jgi:hypothetical protein
MERPSGNYETYNFENTTGATLVQFHFVLKVNDDDAVSFPVFAYIPDESGILNGAFGVIRSEPGSVWQIAQIDDDVTDLNKDDALYMTPGSGNIHATAIDGDYLIGYLTENQSSDDWVKVRLTPPQPVEVEEIA